MRIGLFSDVHGNLLALEKALRVFDDAAVDNLFFLGDSVGYLPGLDVPRRLQAMGISCIRGNHETMLLDERTPAEKDRLYRLNESTKLMDPELRHYFEQWPESLYLEQQIQLVHGSPDAPVSGYVYPDTDLSAIQEAQGRIVVMGHSHRPFVRQHQDRLFINVGSVGLPRDCGWLGSVCVLDTNSGEAQILRFNISDETRRELARHDAVASEVLAVFNRKPVGPVTGIIVD